MSKIKYGILFVVIYIAAAYTYNYYSFKILKAKPRALVYDDFMGPRNQTLIIENLAYKDSIIVYYQWAALHKDYRPFNFPLKTLPANDSVYILGYTDDSLLVEVVSLFDRGPRFGGSYTKGYVYVGTVHRL